MSSNEPLPHQHGHLYICSQVRGMHAYCYSSPLISAGALSEANGGQDGGLSGSASDTIMGHNMLNRHGAQSVDTITELNVLTVLSLSLRCR